LLQLVLQFEQTGFELQKDETVKRKLGRHILASKMEYLKPANKSVLGNSLLSPRARYLEAGTHPEICHPSAS
jgi:hypothetical protein